MTEYWNIFSNYISEYSVQGNVEETAKMWLMADEITSEKHSLLFGKVYGDGGPVKNIEPVGNLDDIDELISCWADQD